MKTRIFKTLTIMSCLAIMLAGSAKATLLTIDKIIFQDGPTVNQNLLMSGTLDLTVSGSTLTLLLKNTSPDNAFSSGDPASMILTGFGLKLPTGVNVTGGTVEINTGSTAVNFNATGFNLATEWNFANQSTNGFLSLLGLGFVDTTFSSVQNGQATLFAGSGSIGGPDFGAISASETQFGSSQEAVRDTIKFVLNLNGAASFDQINAGNVVLAFGSPDRVPDGGSTLALLGVALIGVEFLRRKISKNRLTLN